MKKHMKDKYLETEGDAQTQFMYETEYFKDDPTISMEHKMERQANF